MQNQTSKQHQIYTVNTVAAHNNLSTSAMSQSIIISPEHIYVH